MQPEYELIINRLRQNDPDFTLLDLRQKNLTSEESRAIFQALEENTRVRKLQFLGNNSSGIAAIALGTMLQKNHSIEELELGTNQIDNDDILHIISGLKSNNSVVTLDLNSNLFNTAEPIADLIAHNNCIKEIDLTNSYIDDAGFLKIRDALENNGDSSLSVFNVYFPPISCIDDIQNLCMANASKHGNTMTPV